MKRIRLILIGFSILMMFAVVTGCQTEQKSHDVQTFESMVKTVATGCETELKSYCSQVTPGEGRVLACLYSHSEKLSGRCEYALYDASAQLERFVAELSYVVNECGDDLEKYCGSVRAGQGRLAECLLEKNRDKISNRCSQAAKDVGLE